MEYEELKKIDIEPFNFNWKERSSEYSVIKFLLIDKYLSLFGMQYGLNLSILDNFSYIPAERIEDVHLEDELIEYLSEIHDSNMDVFWDVAVYCGFEISYFSVNVDQVMYEAGDSSDPEDSKYLQKYLEEILSDECQPLLQHVMPIIEEAYKGMENADIILMQNSTIGSYKELCMVYKELIEKKLSEEKNRIGEVLDIIRYPLHYCDEYDDGYFEKVYYICFDTGCNGYNYLDMEDLNYDWVVSAIVLKNLLNDFKEKLQRLLESENVGAA